MDIEGKVKELIVDYLNVDASEVVPEATFSGDLGADSLDTAQLIMNMEDEFDLEIPDEEAKNLKTVGDAINYLKKKLA